MEGNKTLIALLRRIESGQITSGQAAGEIAKLFERDLGFARIDLDRPSRCGLPEVIYCPGKTGRQIVRIMAAMLDAGQNVLATRASLDQYRIIKKAHRKASYNKLGKTITLITNSLPEHAGRVGIICAGTSDIPVAEEAAVTVEFMGMSCERIYDAGVAGLHRVFRHLAVLRQCRALVVVAGMEGALPSVVGGLIARPLIAVPTSIGYGTSLNGIAALLAMLNSCVPGITVVNVDNGFSAGVAAAMIARAGTQAEDT